MSGFYNPQGCTEMDQMAIGDLVNLDLGEQDKYEVLRVQGGWIYTRMNFSVTGETITQMTSVFVPQPFIIPRAN